MDTFEVPPHTDEMTKPLVVQEAWPSEPKFDRPLKLPQGFLSRVDYLLHHPDDIVEALKRDVDLWALSRTLFMITVIMAALYGGVMGATNWLQGSGIPLNLQFLTMLVTAIKVPLLFLLTLLIVVPPIYVSSTFVGSRLTFSQLVGVLLASLAFTTVVLASMASVAFFFSLTTRNYTFIKLLHVAFFAYAGLAGLAYLVRSVHAVVGEVKHELWKWLFIAWLLLYMFVGTQLAWVMRPFVGDPDLKFQLFRPRSGNFYESVYQSVVQLQQDMEKPGKRQ
ncbi:MAG: hypothetical protein HY706_03740 [Candidatus Hydrogenedentes bacterium]|nr:hypothetical protein [Candidatus Hydrogenedentota bacterium]